uniref:Uncharacterized protein n=1 Tax=Lepeophtheirus salmonis TaxID=72036 RepID=A0A0K2V797_LEPSM
MTSFIVTGRFIFTSMNMLCVISFRMKIVSYYGLR